MQLVSSQEEHCSMELQFSKSRFFHYVTKARSHQRTYMQLGFWLGSGESWHVPPLKQWPLHADAILSSQRGPVQPG